VHHVMLDHFAARSTAVHRLDPAAKMAAAVGLILATVLVGRDHFLPLLGPAVALAAYHAVGRIPPWYAAKRLAVVSPFALAILVLFPFFEPGRPVWTMAVGTWTVEVTDAGLARAGHVLLKFLLCAWTTLLLLATTRFQDLLQGLARLRVPRAFVVQLAFLYRYLWVLVDEAMHLRMARAARDGGLGPWRVRFRSRAGIIGVLFIRTFDRAERIYWAMVARGFDGTRHGGQALHATDTSPVRAGDVLFTIGALLLSAGVILGDRLAYG